MKIEHIALWTKNIERLRTFYETYFEAVCGPRYYNLANKFESYFLAFSHGARIELMSKPDLDKRANDSLNIGYSHFAFKVGTIQEVNRLTEKFREAGIPIVGEPRHTGDGYYESVILDPDGNRIELVA